MDDKTNNISNEFNHKKMLKKRNQIPDEELTGVTGGYWETQGYAAGYWIECPNCGREDISAFTTWMDLDQHVDRFRCRCGCTFAVDESGFMMF